MPLRDIARSIFAVLPVPRVRRTGETVALWAHPLDMQARSGRTGLAPRRDQAAEKVVRCHPFLGGQGDEFSMAGGRELLSWPKRRAGCPPQHLAVETEPLGVFSYNLTLGVVPGGGDGDVFIPFDVLVGKMINKSTVVSVEFATPLVNDYDLYDWMIEFRIGLLLMFDKNEN